MVQSQMPCSIAEAPRSNSCGCAAAADPWLLCAAALGMGALHIINSGWEPRPFCSPFSRCYLLCWPLHMVNLQIGGPARLVLE
jgi:hypothetical protein